MSLTLLSVNNYFYRRGGAEVVFLEHNRIFETAGWQVVPFAMQHEQNLPSEWSAYFPQEIEFGRDYSLPRKISSAFKITHSFEASAKIARLAERVTPDIAHAHNIYHHLSPSIFSALKRQGVPTVLTLHDLKIACPAYKMLAEDGICERCKGGNIFNVVKHRCIKGSLAVSLAVFMETGVQRLLGSYSKYVDRFVVPSRFYLEKFVEWGWPRERFVHIPNFVDVKAHNYSDEVGSGFVYFGRLGPEKGLETLVRAAAQSGCEVVIVGTGPEEQKLRKLVEALQAPVTFAGYQTGAALHQYIRSARALVLPSEWYENAPMSVMESYALGTPVIGADIGGIPELIRAGETGAVFESGNTDALAAVLREYANMPEGQMREMGGSGRAWVEQAFTDDRYRERVLDLYRSLGVG